MDEVLAAEVLHPTGNVSHKLHQHLRREVLKRIKDTGFELHFLFCPAEGSRAHVSEDGSAELKLGAALQEHLLCFYTSGPFRILQKPCSDSALKMAPSSWQSGKNRILKKHCVQQQIKLQIANNDLSVCARPRTRQSLRQRVHAKLNFGYHFADRIHMNCSPLNSLSW